MYVVTSLLGFSGLSSKKALEDSMDYTHTHKKKKYIYIYIYKGEPKTPKHATYQPTKTLHHELADHSLYPPDPQPDT